MNQDDIISMAREADLTDGIELQREIDAVMRFAELVAAAERKDCADIAEYWSCNGMPRTTLADQIRARGQHEQTIKAYKVGGLIVAYLPKVTTGGGGIKPEPTINNWPLYSGLPQPKEDQGLTTNPLPAIKLQEDWSLGVGFKKAVPESWAQSAQVIGTQKKEWVGLTKEDLETVHQELLSMSGGSFNTVAKAIENKLKEKNT
jgi:hypothetical protein